MNAQMPISRKKKMADFRIDNNGSIGKTEKRVNRIFREIQAQQR
jgi:dephospho-CoA kinase